MKIENLDKALQLHDQLKAIKRASKQVAEAISKVRGKQYSGVFTEYHDGSGFAIELDSTGIIGDALASIQAHLLNKQVAVQQEIAGL